jgi:hypothetical protein
MYIFEIVITNIEIFHIQSSLLAAAFIIILVFAPLISISSNSILTATVASQSSSSVTEVGAPGSKGNEYYIFTQDLNANESKLGVPVAIFTLTNIIVHKGDTVTIHFYNTADDKEDRHTFTMQSPYKMDYLLL